MLEGIEPVRLVGEAEIHQLEAVARIAPAEREDQLGLIVGLADRSGLPVVEHLPIHHLRIGEPQACAVEPEVAEEAGDAGVLECLARDQLRLEAGLDLDLVPVDILDEGAAGRRAARLLVRPAGPAVQDVVRAIRLDIGDAAYAGILWSQSPGPRKMRGSFNRAWIAFGKSVITSEPLFLVLD